MAAESGRNRMEIASYAREVTLDTLLYHGFETNFIMTCMKLWHHRLAIGSMTSEESIWRQTSCIHDLAFCALAFICFLRFSRSCRLRMRWWRKKVSNSLKATRSSSSHSVRQLPPNSRPMNPPTSAASTLHQNYVVVHNCEMLLHFSCIRLWLMTVF